MKKSLIIGAFGGYEWPQIATWVKSIDACGFKGDKVVIALNTSYATLEKLFEHGCQAIVFNRDDENQMVFHTSAIKVHVERFLFIYEFLKERWQDYDYVVTTDMRDVLFQTDPVQWLRDNLNGKQIVATGEGIRIKDEPWNRENFAETYGPALYRLHKEFEVYNVGVLGGTSEYMKDMALNIFSAGINRTIPIVDQAVLNCLIQAKPVKDVVRFTSQDETWACQAGVTVDPSKIEGYRPFLMHPAPVFDKGVIKNGKGEVFSMVHQYDRVPAWNDYFMKKYSS
jgi:hypothetical protein